MNGFKFVAIFEYKGRMCVVIERNMSLPSMIQVRGFNSLGIFHMGYVSTKDNARHDYDSIGSLGLVELTFSGQLERYKEVPKNINFLGFDTGHGYNIPEEQTAGAVKDMCERLADEMIKEDI